jgi:hypothetical protein
MSDPRRLIDDDVSDFEVALLRAGRGELPPSGARNRVLASVGLATGMVAATATATTAAAAATKGGGAFAGALVLKALGAVALVSAVSVGGVQYVKTHRAAAPPATQAPVTTPAKPVVAAKPAVLPQAPLAPVAPAPVPEPTLAVAPSPTAAVVESPAPQPSLAKELAVLDEARKALGSDPARALALVDQHDKGFPGGALGQEATVLRIDALARLGRTGEAKTLAQTFVAAHPDSPNAARVRKIIDTGTTANQ